MNIKKLKVTANQSYYEIQNTDILLDTVAMLYGKAKSKSKLYRYNNKYYLEVDKTISLTNVKRNKSIHLKGQLEEYGKLICNNAIAKIGSKIREL